MSLRSALLIITGLALVAPAGAQAALPQTWVSGVGDDVNPCDRSSPCKTFAGAQSKTDPGGVINVLDSGAYGVVNINKALTIDGRGSFAGVVATGQSAITVNAGAGRDVVLRGLTLEYKAPCTTTGAQHGIRFLSGRSLVVDDVRVQGFPGAGIDAEPTGDGASVTVTGSSLLDNCTAGLLARRAAGHVDAVLTDSFLARDGTGVLAGAGATVTVARNTIINHATGLGTETGGVLQSFGDNHLAGSLADGAPTVLLNPPPPATTTTTVTNTVTTTTTVEVPVAVTPPPVATPCRVPPLTGRTVTGARRWLTRAHCRLGPVRYRAKAGKRRNRVYAQTARAERVLPAGTAVGITLSGRKPAVAQRAVVGGLTRTWVSAAIGDDTNPCSRSAPCLTFQGALGVTSDGGTIDVLDPGDYGPLTIDAPVTIDGAGQQALVVATPGSSAITVNAPASAGVTLRGLTLVTNPGCSAPGAGHGVDVVAGGPLHLEDVTARGFAGAGVRVAPTADQVVSVRGGALTDNCTAGITAQRPGGRVEVTVDGTRLAHDATGVLAGDGALVRLARTAVTGQTTGLATAGTGVLQGWDDNQIGPNTADGTRPSSLDLQ